MHPIISEDLDTILRADLPWSELAGKRVVVTGAGGFLASWFVRTLAALNDKGELSPCHIVAIVRDQKRALHRLETFVGRKDFHLVTCDLSRDVPSDWKPDIIIHAASPASPQDYLADPIGTLEINTTGTSNLLRWAERSEGACLMFVSSGEVYGQTSDGLITETDYGYLDPASVRSCYGEAKRAGEALCVAWSAQKGVVTRIIRPMHTYGPGISLTDGRVFADFTSDILARRDIVLKSDGVVRRPFCYISDAMIGYFTVLLKGETALPYSVGNDQAVLSIRALADLLVNQAFPELGLKLVFANPDISPATPTTLIRGSIPDLARLRALGWSPAVDPATGFRRTVMSFSQA